MTTVKKDSVTDILDHLSEDEMQRVVLLKNRLEDLNLILQEIEDTYEKLSEISLTEKERKIEKQRLYTLERYLAELNEKVNNAIGVDSEIQKLS
jgi:hypothetical protein